MGEIIVCHSEWSKTICCQFPPCCTVTSKQALAYEGRATVPCLLADGASVAPRLSPSVPVASDCCPGQQLENETPIYQPLIASLGTLEAKKPQTKQNVLGESLAMDHFVILFAGVSEAPQSCW